MNKYDVYLYDKNDNFLTEIPVENFEIHEILNGVNTVSLTIDFNNFKYIVERQGYNIESLLTSGLRIIEIRRSGAIFFRGIMTEAKISKFDININLQITAKNWLAYFGRRLITKTYTNTNAGDIAWDLINTAQSVNYGNIGITRGVNETTVSRDRSYQDISVLDAIIKLSSDNIINGFEFEITNNKIFNVKNRLGSDKPYLVLDKSNVINWNVNLTLGLNLTNSVILTGSGFDANQVRTTVNSSDTYKQKWYLLEKYISYPSVSYIDTLTEHGNKFLSLNQDYSKYFDLKIMPTTIDISDFIVGDALTIDLDFISGLFRVKERIISVNETSETVDLKFLL